MTRLTSQNSIGTRFIQVIKPCGAYGYLPVSLIEKIEEGTVGNTKITTASGRMYFRDEGHAEIKRAQSALDNGQCLIIKGPNCKRGDSVVAWSVIEQLYIDSIRVTNSEWHNSRKRLLHLFIAFFVVVAVITFLPVVLGLASWDWFMTLQACLLGVGAVFLYRAGVSLLRADEYTQMASELLFNRPLKDQPLLEEEVE